MKPLEVYKFRFLDKVIHTDMQTPGLGTFPGWELKKYPQVTGFNFKHPSSDMSWWMRGRSPLRENFAFSRKMGRNLITRFGIEKVPPVWGQLPRFSIKPPGSHVLTTRGFAYLQLYKVLIPYIALFEVYRFRFLDKIAQGPKQPTQRLSRFISSGCQTRLYKVIVAYTTSLQVYKFKF